MSHITVDGKDQCVFGSSADERELLWGGIHQDIVAIVGSGGFTIPMGDPNHEDSGLTVVTGHGTGSPDLTYKPGTRTAFDSLMYYKGPGQIPVLPFNGLDEYVEGLDATMWSHLDGSGTNGFSFVFWADVITGIPALGRALLTKWGTDKEYIFAFDADDKLECILYDETQGVACQRLSDAAVPMGAMTMFGVTYAGIGGDTAANFIDLYVDGVQLASSPTNDPLYEGMRNGTAPPMIGRDDGPGNNRWFTGAIAGGPLGPFSSKDLIGIAGMKQLYHLGRSAMAL